MFLDKYSEMMKIMGFISSKNMVIYDDPIHVGSIFDSATLSHFSKNVFNKVT